MKFEEAMIELDAEDSSEESSDDEESEGEKLAEQLDMLLNFTFKDIPER
jgi:hypothetical protein